MVYIRSPFIGRHCQNAGQQQVANIIHPTANNIWEAQVSVCIGVSGAQICLFVLLSPSSCARLCCGLYASSHFVGCPDNSEEFMSAKWQMICDVISSQAFKNTYSAQSFEWCDAF